MQVLLPLEKEYPYPGGQDKHAPVVALHTVQFAQAAHEAAPVFRVNLPDAQVVHVVLPPVEYVPARQDVQMPNAENPAPRGQVRQAL